MQEAVEASNPSAAIGTPVEYEKGRVRMPGELVAQERGWEILGDTLWYS